MFRGVTDLNVNSLGNWDFFPGASHHVFRPVGVRTTHGAFQPGDGLTEHFIRELHALTVKELEREGDDTPGAYRQKQVKISQSEHLPPEFIQVPHYMQELVTLAVTLATPVNPPYSVLPG